MQAAVKIIKSNPIGHLNRGFGNTVSILSKDTNMLVGTSGAQTHGLGILSPTLFH